MADLRSLDAQSEVDGARSTSLTRTAGGADLASACRIDEITRLRKENERLRRGLREIRELLEPAPARPTAPAKVFPTIGLL